MPHVVLTALLRALVAQLKPAIREEGVAKSVPPAVFREVRLLLSYVRLTLSRVLQLRAKAKQAALPEGWYYNGNTYMSIEGDRQEDHPALIQVRSRRVST